MRTLWQMPGACCPTALWVVSGKSQAEVARACIGHNWDSEGMHTEEWLKVAPELGLVLIKTSFRKEMTLGEFASKAKATFLIETADNHLLVVAQGKIIDLRSKSLGRGRKITGVYRVKER